MDLSTVLVTGPHGGTFAQNAVALFVAPAVNVAVYWLIIIGAHKLFRKLVPRKTETGMLGRAS
jgi:arginine exporter protein ArgO